jgi:hypothetical protein
LVRRMHQPATASLEQRGAFVLAQSRSVGVSKHFWLSLASFGSSPPQCLPLRLLCLLPARARPRHRTAGAQSAPARTRGPSLWAPTRTHLGPARSRLRPSRPRSGLRNGSERFARVENGRRFVHSTVALRSARVESGRCIVHSTEALGSARVESRSPSVYSTVVLRCVFTNGSGFIVPNATFVRAQSRAAHSSGTGSRGLKNSSDTSGPSMQVTRRPRPNARSWTFTGASKKPM